MVNKLRLALLVFFTTSLFLIYFTLTLPGEVQAQPGVNCIKPRPFPNLINQSGTICPGTYRFGIGIGADNLRVECPATANFSGVAWQGRNGVTISGRKNITIIGCNFERFRENGVFVGEENHTNEISLINIKSVKNAGNGIFVGFNVVEFYLRNSEIKENRLDGIVFKTNYLGKFNDVSARLFPSNLYILNNSVVNNRKNGIAFDAYDYLALINIVNQTNLFSNGSITIYSNNISSNHKNGIQSIGFNSPASHILNNTISFNGHFATGSGISILADKSRRVLNFSVPNFENHGLTGFQYIYFNDIEGNFFDGISLYLARQTAPSLAHARNWSFKVEGVYHNYIRNNLRHGVSFLGEKNTDNLIVFVEEILQNDISSNSGHGIYFKGLNKNSGEWLNTYIICNDINSNANGVEIINFSKATGMFLDRNIVENNFLGLLVEKRNTAGEFLIGWNYFGFNSEGLRLFGNATSLGLNRIRYNDFDQNVLQAYDLLNSNFSSNWWSDYSPTCVDSQPDGWCDIPRPVPVANQDIPTKAGAIWGWKNRGYFVRANPGVVPKSICQIPDLPEPPGVDPGQTGGGGKKPGGTTGETDGVGSSSGTTTGPGEPPGK